MADVKDLTDGDSTKGVIVRDDAELILEGNFKPHYLDVPSLEASLHYAALQRLREDDMFNVPQSQRTSLMARIFAPKIPNLSNEIPLTTDVEKSPKTSRTTVSEEEKRTAQRALRTASWVSVFYLITTEYIALFDTENVCVKNAQGLSQISKGHVCFSLLAIIWMLLGMGLGQIRSLKNFGGMLSYNVNGGKPSHFRWVVIAHSAIWINLVAIFLTMGAIAHSPPNFASALTQNNIPKGPIIVKAIVNQPFAPQLVGVMQMSTSQLVIVTIYMVFGIYVYAFQGQFAINPANQGISKFGLQTAGNVLTLVSGLIAAALYGNIGIKVIYSTIIEELFNGPQLLSRSGRMLWTVMVISYWALAFIIASAIPQFSNVNAAICILQFSYTFPPILYAGFIIQRDALQGQPEFTPGANVGELRNDTWWNWSRWRRGFARRWWLNTFNILLGIAALALAGLGSFSSIEGIITTFKTSGSATSFGCKSPV
ncbi:hypothetical protein Clacol_003382 [Clathrus columnatus]|uniref:Amino acid transporter transmembrane domain-containing protein n=1 Tax=Clathrus columnatus TaxID=1419009 RepID=A0AAV5AB56_9AGAM|nr:hypothetical protein Clacol_003382 [Clathrus columnatus]